MGTFAFGNLSRSCAAVAAMDVKAILLVGGRECAEAAPKLSSPAETLSGIPIAYLDVLGLPVLEHVLQRLQRFGVSAVTLIGPVDADAEPFARRATLRPDMPWIQAGGKELWKSAEAAFKGYVEQGAELVLAVRVGAYAEVDYEELIQHHLDHRCPVTMATDVEGASLDVFVLSASRRNDASGLFRSEMKKLRTNCKRFSCCGYVNRLQTPGDLRRLAMDGLLSKNSIRPVGTEIKPGVWVAEGARIHRKARIVAPAFIGARAKIRASALITRSTVVEHHSVVDCGTVVENATILPFTCVGAGLDVMHCVVGFRRIYHLVRNVAVEIHDQKLVSMTPANPLSRLAGSTGELFAFLPKQIYRGLFAPSHPESAADLPESLDQPASALETSVVEAKEPGSKASEFPSDMAVARRYGEE
jgi:NDP-sugar pyrophosphorylase family protein